MTFTITLARYIARQFNIAVIAAIEVVVARISIENILTGATKH